MTKAEKILACYYHVKARSIHKIVGCTINYTYEVLNKAGLKIPNYTIQKNKLPKFNKWSKI